MKVRSLHSTNSKSADVLAEGKGDVEYIEEENSSQISYASLKNEDCNCHDYFLLLLICLQVWCMKRLLSAPSPLPCTRISSTLYHSSYVIDHQRGNTCKGLCILFSEKGVAWSGEWGRTVFIWRQDLMRGTGLPTWQGGNLIHFTGQLAMVPAFVTSLQLW